MSDRYFDPYPGNLKRHEVVAAETDAEFWRRISTLESGRSQVMRERLIKDKCRYREAIKALMKLAKDKGFAEEAKEVLRNANN